MLHIETAQVEDAARILEIKRLAYTGEDRRFDGGSGVYLQFIGDEAFVPWCLSHYLLYKLLLDDVTIGCFWLDGDSSENGDSLELQDFCIHPDYQNKGYGRACLALMEAQHPEVRLWRLSTRPRSVRNRRLYESAGYRLIRETDSCAEYEKHMPPRGEDGEC